MHGRCPLCFYASPEAVQITFFLTSLRSHTDGLSHGLPLALVLQLLFGFLLFWVLLFGVARVVLMQLSTVMLKCCCEASGWCSRMYCMNSRFMRRMTALLISSKLRSVFPCVRTWLPTEIQTNMRNKNLSVSQSSSLLLCSTKRSEPEAAFG